MQSSFRKVLVESNVGIAMVGTLLFWAVYGVFLAMGDVARPLVFPTATAIAIHAWPAMDRYDLILFDIALTEACARLLQSALNLLLALLLSRWIFDLSLRRSLGMYGKQLARRSHV